MISSYLESVLGLFKCFFSVPFVTEFYMIVLAGLGMIYIIKSILFFRRDS